MVSPETGERYHPNDMIEVPGDDGTVARKRAQDYYDGINETERMLSEWGYSLRDGGDPATLSRLNYCAAQMEEQRKHWQWEDQAAAVEAAEEHEDEEDGVDG